MNEVWAADDLLEATRRGEEIWRPVVNGGGWYDVSNLGGFRSWKGCRGERNPTPNILKPCPQTDGYPSIGMRVDGKTVSVTVHVAMAEAFISPRPGPTSVWECGHVDDDRTRNLLTNIRWVTRQVNQADRRRNELPNASLRPVRDVDGVKHYRCTRCDTWKPETAFGRIRGKNAQNSVCGLMPECRPCTSARRNELRRRAYRRLTTP